MIPIDMPFEFKRSQFLVLLILTNKAQGRSQQVRGLNWENSCFARGQLYIAYSFSPVNSI
jgi:hypothetical protein